MSSNINVDTRLILEVAEASNPPSCVSKIQDISNNPTTDKVALTAFGVLCCAGVGILAASIASMSKITSWPTLTPEDLEILKTVGELGLTFLGSAGILAGAYGIRNCFKK